MVPAGTCEGNRKRERERESERERQREREREGDREREQESKKKATLKNSRPLDDVGGIWSCVPYA